MITRLQRLTTGISVIQEIPTHFFQRIETALNFGNHLFPPWAINVFSATDMFLKFEAVYNKYKKIRSKIARDRIIDTFNYSNQIEDLCCNSPRVVMIELNELPKSIQKEIDALFNYLYKISINYQGFESHVNDSVRASIDRFIISNRLEVCPFCGIEGFHSLAGQSRIALDHWLCKDIFPMSAVNFDNLFPIGSKCNERPAKGSKNILIESAIRRNRIQAFYPYLTHDGIQLTFNFINEPSISGISDTDWIFSINPVNISEQSIFDSWNSTLNITIRYLDFFRKNIFTMWQLDYKRFIEEDHDVSHAQTIDELKNNFRLWRASFPPKGRPGSILYRCFIDYLINRASNSYLYGLCENLRR